MQSFPFDFQPILVGSRIKLRPLQEADWTALFKAASDPLIWEQHPESLRYTEPVFKRYFEGAIKSKGAFAVVDKKTEEIIGSTRYYVDESGFCEDQDHVVIGYTFLKKEYWGSSFNQEMKKLLLDHAFQFVSKAFFHVGTKNRRSQKAMEKIGGRIVGEFTVTMFNGLPNTNHIYLIEG